MEQWSYQDVKYQYAVTRNQLGIVFIILYVEAK